MEGWVSKGKYLKDNSGSNTVLYFQVRIKIQYPKGAKALRKAYWYCILISNCTYQVLNISEHVLFNNPRQGLLIYYQNNLYIMTFSGLALNSSTGSFELFISTGAGWRRREMQTTRKKVMITLVLCLTYICTMMMAWSGLSSLPGLFIIRPVNWQLGLYTNWPARPLIMDRSIQ